MDPIYVLSTHKCAHRMLFLSLSLSFCTPHFLLINLFIFKHQLILPIDVCVIRRNRIRLRMLCCNYRTSFFSFSPQYRPIYTYVLFSQSVFSMSTICQRFFFTRTHHHITSHRKPSIFLMPFPVRFFLFANEFRDVRLCMCGFFLFIIIIIFDQQLLRIRFSWSFLNGFLCHFSYICVRAIFFFALLSSRKKKREKTHIKAPHTQMYHQIGSNSGYKWKSIQAKTRLKFNAFILHIVF